jgi:FkbM family methyltransferase
MRILWGPLHGTRWIVGSGNHVCWLGLYEYRKQLALQRMLTAGSSVYDIGAHVGFHTLLASQIIGPSGHVSSFEPLTRNLRYLREHLRINGANNVQVIEAAVADQTGIEAFIEHGSYMGGLQSTGQLRVQTIAIDKLLETGTIPPPDCVKLDVEGGEMRALQGMRETLSTFGPTIFLATHSPSLHVGCVHFLTELGYRVHPLTGSDIYQTDELVASHPAFPRSNSW